MKGFNKEIELMSVDYYEELMTIIVIGGFLIS